MTTPGIPELPLEFPPGFPIEYAERSFQTYRELCSKTLRVYLTLFVAVLGQTAAVSWLFEVLTGRWRLWLALAMTYSPFVLYSALTYLYVPPPISPRTYRRLLLVVAWWFAANAALSVFAAPLWSRAPKAGWVSVVVVCGCNLVGLTAIATILKYQRKLRSHEFALSGTARTAIGYRDTSSKRRRGL